MEVRAAPFEKRVVLHIEHKVEVSGGPTMHSGFPEPAKTNSSLIFYACRYLGFNGLLLYVAAFAPALCAGIADYRPLPLAGRASARNTEEALLISHLAAPATGSTSGWGLAVCAPRSITGIAKLVAAVGDGLLGTENCFFELDRDVLAQISTTL